MGLDGCWVGCTGHTSPDSAASWLVDLRRVSFPKLAGGGGASSSSPLPLASPPVWAFLYLSGFNWAAVLPPTRAHLTMSRDGFGGRWH